MSNKPITLDIDDITGAFYIFALENRKVLQDVEFNESPLDEARRQVKWFFEYVDRWQSSGLRIGTIERESNDGMDKR